MITICALIAAYNEERHVADVVNGTARYVSAVFVVDDGSTDRTGSRAAAAGATVIAHDSNQGKGCAVRTGLSHVLRGPYSHVLLLDGALQHDPDEIPKLVECAARGVGDFVVGEREFSRTAMPAPGAPSSGTSTSCRSPSGQAAIVSRRSRFRKHTSVTRRRSSSPSAE
jgi:glycosyltransferase involved in cell wall biosynthesis